jgi:hypothetical protein
MVNIDNNNHKKLRFDLFNENHTPSWIVPTIVGAWFVGLILLFWVYSYTQVSLLNTLKYFLFFALLFTLIPYRWTVKVIPMEYHFHLILNFMGIGPVLTSLFFLLNFAFSNHPETHTVRIMNVEYGEGFNASNTVIQLKEGQLRDAPKFRTFDSAYRLEILDSDDFQYTLEEGLFGYKVLSDYSFVTNHI